MNKNTVYKPIVLGICTAVAVYFSLFEPNIPTVSYTPEITSPLPSATISHPKKITISKINLRTTIDSVGLTEENAMADPPVVHHAAWYQYGPKPGEKGNAVLAGHYDDNDGPSIFYQLDTLTYGDYIYIEDINGHVMIFSVIDKRTYRYEDFPIQKVFGSSSNERLNLITCAGEYNESKQTYEDRLVVVAELVEKKAGIITQR